MDKMPSFNEIWIDFFFSIHNMFFALAMIIIVSALVATRIYHFVVKNKIEEKEKKEIKVLSRVLSIITILFALMITLWPSIYAVVIIENQQEDIFMKSEVNRKWFKDNHEELYRGNEINEYKILEINSIKKVYASTFKQNDPKKDIIRQSLKGETENNVYLMYAAVENNKGKEEYMEFVVTLETTEKNEIKVLVRNTNDNKEDVGKRVNYGKILISSSMKEMFEN